MQFQSHRGTWKLLATHRPFRKIILARAPRSPLSLKFEPKRPSKLPPALPSLILATLGLSLTASADITATPDGFSWTEDFEGAALGTTSGSGDRILGTSAQTVNTATSIVVDATTDPTAAAAFTKAYGNFIRLSV